MSYTDIETSLGIKNFRREYSGLVQSLSAIKPIDPILEPLTKAATYNTRFKQLGEAIRHCFNAAGDVAIRDKRYLETFLTGYANPIISSTHKYADPYSYQNVPAFNTNGVPISFPENRVIYNVSNLGELNNTACYHWVFKNGVLLAKSKYDLLNTAYGVKCFIKATEVAPNDEINIVVNRIFNSSKDASTITIANGGPNITFTVPVAQLGTFYHHKYIKLFVRRGTDPSRSFLEIPRAKYTTEIDTTGTTIKLDIRGFNINNGEVLHIMNAVYWWQYEAEGVIDANWKNEVVLSEKQADNVTYRPVPFLSAHDFDVFFNGFHLQAGKHFTIIKGGNEFSPFKIKLLFRPPVGDPYSFRVYKNESVAEDRDFVYIKQDTIDNKGMITAPDVTTLPLIGRLGHCFLSDKHVPASHIKNVHRRILTLEDVTSVSNFEYRLRIVSTLDIENVLAFVNDNLSEFDMVANWFGLDAIKDKLKETRPVIIVDPANIGFTPTHNWSGWEHYDVLTAAVEQFRVIADAYLNDKLTRTLILDPNVLIGPTYPLDIVDDMLVLDSNMLQSDVKVLDANVFFVP